MKIELISKLSSKHASTVALAKVDACFAPVLKLARSNPLILSPGSNVRGGGRNHVLQDAAATAPILLGGAVHRLLRRSGGVDGGHQAALVKWSAINGLFPFRYCLAQ